jgi:hypothetical protein
VSDPSLVVDRPRDHRQETSETMGISDRTDLARGHCRWMSGIAGIRDRSRLDTIHGHWQEMKISGVISNALNIYRGSLSGKFRCAKTISLTTEDSFATLAPGTIITART